MSGWRREPFDSVIADESGGNLKTPQSEFLAAGRYPIVDQGKDLIAGYTDDESRLCRATLPVIVFGDHTRCFKYVDFPFCMGADGVKVLRPKIEADVKYLYHYLRQLRLTDGGYDRHFKYLKRSTIALPPFLEQRRISATLDKADALRAKRRAALAHLETLIESIFLDALGDVARWPTRLLSELCEGDAPITYGILQPGPDVVDGVPYIRPSEILGGRIDVQALRKTSPEIAERYRKSSLKAGDILITIVGTIGKVAVVPRQLEGANITQSSARVRVHKHKADRRFVELFLRSHGAKRQFDQNRLGVAVERLNLHHVRDLEVPTPPLAVQTSVAAKAMAVERLHLIMRRSLDAADSLFTSLQHRAFHGGLRE